MRRAKQVDLIPTETMAAFQWYSWPGNIRELQNLVERAVILSREGVLPNPLHKRQTEVTLPTQHRFPVFPSSMTLMTLEDSDRALIVDTLGQAGWIVGGPRGAGGRQYGASEDIETLQGKNNASTSRFRAVEECGSPLARRSELARIIRSREDDPSLTD
jgi:DNA-binding NtrC family response regulator